jgi:putative oxidoreductase
MDRANDLVLLIGRLLMSAVFLPSGIGKLLGFSDFAASLATKGLPYPEAWAAAAVAIEVLGPIALILGFLPRWTALLLIAFVAMASGTSHRYWEFTEAAARRAQEINFYKNVGIIVGLLFYFASGPGAWSLARRKSPEVAQPQPA